MIVNFGEFRLDTNRYQLFKNSQPVDVEPQVFTVLQLLIEQRHRVVTKDDLIKHVWQGRIMSDAAISSRIKSARQALDDDGRTQRFIKTVHGIGFRFVGEVNVYPDDNKLEANRSKDSVSIEVGDKRPSIVILPFTQEPNDTSSIVSQGLAHDLITGLSRLRWLKVISRSSAFRVANTEADLSSLCELTSVRYCLSGFMRIDGTSITLNFELSDLASASVLHADQCVIQKDEINQIRSEITNKLITLLELQISENEAQRAQLKSTENLDAWEAYHLATAHLYRFTGKDNEQATHLFKRAISMEPSFARAHAGLSAAEFQNAFNLYAGVDRNRAVESAIHSAEKSIELDRLDPLANFVMGRSYWLKGDTEHSIAWLDRAITLNPNYAHGYYAYGLASLMASDEQRVYDHSAHAISLSPLDPFLYGFYGIKAFSYLADEDVKSARVWAEKAALQPEAIALMDVLAAAMCEMDDDISAARKWVEFAKKRNPLIDQNYFFKALPFSHGKIRSLISSSLIRLGM